MEILWFHLRLTESGCMCVCMCVHTSVCAHLQSNLCFHFISTLGDSDAQESLRTLHIIQILKGEEFIGQIVGASAKGFHVLIKNSIFCR